MRFYSFKYTLSYIKNNQKRVFFDLLAFSVFNIALFLVSCFGQSFTLSYNNHIEKIYGKYQFQLVEENQETIQSILSNREIDKVGNVSFYGRVVNKGVSGANIGSIDQKALEQLSIQVISGNMPTKQNEIVLEESVFYQVSDSIDNNAIEIEYIDSENNSYKKQYVVTGIIKNYSTFHMNDRNYKLPGIIVYSSSINPDMFLLTLHNPNNWESFYNEVSSNKLLINQGWSNSQTNLIVSIFKIVNLLLIAFGFCFLTCTILFHSTDDRNRATIMKCCGANNSLLLKTRLNIVLFTFIPSFVIGSVIGLRFSKFLIEKQLSKVINYLAFNLDNETLFLSTCLSFISILSVSFIFELHACKKRPLQSKKNKRNKQQSSIYFSYSQYKKFPLLVWGIKSFFNRKCAYFFSIIATVLVMACIMFEIAALNSVIDNHQVATYDYTMGGGFSNRYFSSLQIVRETYAQIYPKDLNAILETDEVSFCSAYTMQRFHILRDGKGSDSFPYSKLGTDSYLFSQEQITTEKKKLGYKDTEELYITTLVTCNDMLLDELLHFSILKTNDYKKESEVILVCLNDPFFQVGDKVTLTQPFINETGEIEIIRKTASIAAIIQRQDITAHIDVPTQTGNYFVSSVEFYESFANFPGYTNMGVTLKNHDNFQKTDYILNQIKTINGENCYLISNREINMERERTAFAISTIGGLISLTLVCVCLLNFGTICKSTYYDNKKSWGALRCCGLTMRKATIHTTIELTIAISIAWIIANFVLLTILIIGFKSFSVGFANFPFNVSGLLLIVCVLCGFLVSVISTTHFWKNLKVNKILREI